VDIAFAVWGAGIAALLFVLGRLRYYGRMVDIKGRTVEI